MISNYRYKALDRLDADRKLLLFQHLGFITCPIREHCPAFPHCTDSLVERIVAAKKAAQGRPPSWSRTTDSNHLNLVVLGVEELATELADQIRVKKLLNCIICSKIIVKCIISIFDYFMLYSIYISGNLSRR